MSAPRGFHEVPLVPTSVQPPFRRPTQDDSDPPATMYWRLNLSALSHVHNLLFMATGPYIQVYEPEFPGQTIREPPSLTLNPPRFGLRSQPREDEDDDEDSGPLPINHLIVDFRGTEEIVLVACHDGDAIGYRTDDIRDAIDRQSEPDYVQQVDAQKLRPMFHINMSSSAWGLAIHREARLIAVSCNRHLVTVFAPALVKTESQFEDDLGELDAVGDEDRYNDRVIELPRVRSNIPAIAFCNTGEDPEGRWLLIGDVTGSLCVASIWANEVVEYHDCRYCGKLPGNHPFVRMSLGREPGCMCARLAGRDDGLYFESDAGHAIWGLAFLDKRSFKRTNNYEAFGHVPTVVDNQVYDCSNGRNYVRNASYEWTPSPDPENPGEDPPDPQNVLPYPAEIVPGHGPNMEWEYEIPPSEVFYQAWGNSHMAVPPHLTWNAERIRVKRTPHSQYLSRLISANLDGYSYERHAPPTSPILQLSVRDIFLLHSVDPRTQRQRHPTIAAHDPLCQIINLHQDNDANSNEWLKHVHQADHLGLHAVIPELGVFLVGSAKGRVGVFSMTQTLVHREPVYAFRLDHIVPFADQEAEARPKHTLVGLAVGPVQGMLGESNPGLGRKRRRWRVMLVYDDTSVLSYEFGKADGNPEPGVEVMMI